MNKISTKQHSTKQHILRRSAAAIILMTGLVGSTVALAQSDQQPATRASVRADLVRMEAVGYVPQDDRQTYPLKTQAAERAANPATGPQYRVADTSQAQQGPVTHAELRQELGQLERAGYKPDEDRNTYPNDLQAAERRVNTGQ